MNKNEAIDWLNDLGYNELASMVNEMHIDQYGQPVPEGSFLELDKSKLIEWVLQHYEWNVDEMLWESKKVFDDPMLDFTVITEADLSPQRILH